MRLFIDGEWNGYRGELISMALVAEDGREFYAVLGCANPEPWVAEHVMPKLGVPPGFQQESTESVQVRLALFLAQFDAAHIVADWPEDIERFCRLLITGPGTRIDTPPLTMEVVRVDAPSKNPHNALADARGLRDSLAIARAADYLRAQADAQPVAWMHPDGRVVPAATIDAAYRDGGAMKSSLRNYTIPLYPPPAPAAPQAESIDPHMIVAEDRFPDEQAEPKREPNPDEVICPACTHQFRAIPENVQAQLWAKREPLSDTMVIACARVAIARIQPDEWVATDADLIDFARAIESEHGIGGSDAE